MNFLPDFLSNFTNIWPAIQKLGTMVFTGFSILAFVGGCNLPSFGGRSSGPSEANYGILKYDASIRKESFVKTNAIQSLINDQINIDGLGLSNIYKIESVGPQVVFALTGNSLYKSLDSGTIWKKLSIYPIITTANTEDAKIKEKEAILTKDASFEAWDFATVKDNEKVIYLSGKQNGQGKIFRSLDSGANFSQIYADPSQNTIVEKITLDPNNPNLVYAILGNQKMLKSSDAGNTWKNLKTSEDQIIQFGFLPEFGNLFYLLTKNTGLELSDDQGETWKIKKLEKTDKTELNNFQKILPVNTTLVANPATGQVQASVTKAFLLIAGDKLWQTKDLSTQGFTEIKLPSQNENNKLSDVAVDPISGLAKIYLSIENNLLETQDLGQTWATNDKLNLDSKVGNINLIMTSKNHPETIYLGLGNK
jgi:photosystem II stability/assembly factor-like uncharacterized protein